MSSFTGTPASISAWLLISCFVHPSLGCSWGMESRAWSPGCHLLSLHLAKHSDPSAAVTTKPASSWHSPYWKSWHRFLEISSGRRTEQPAPFLFPSCHQAGCPRAASIPPPVLLCILWPLWSWLGKVVPVFEHPGKWGPRKSCPEEQQQQAGPLLDGRTFPLGFSVLAGQLFSHITQRDSN